MATLVSLDFDVLCEIASYLAVESFRNFVSTCRQFSSLRHDIRTVARVFVNGSGNIAKALEDAFKRKARDPILRFMIRRMSDEEFKAAVKIALSNRKNSRGLMRILDQELCQDQKLYLFKHASKVYENLDLTQLLGLWHWTPDSLDKLSSMIAECDNDDVGEIEYLLTPIRFLLDRTVPSDPDFADDLFALLVEFKTVDEAIALIPRLTDEAKMCRIIEEFYDLIYEYLDKPDQARLIILLVESLSLPLGSDDRMEALAVAAKNGNETLMEYFQKNLDKKTIAETVAHAAIEGNQVEILCRYIKFLRPTRRLVESLTDMVVYNEKIDDVASLNRLYDVFLGDRAQPYDAPFVRIVACLIDHDLLNHKMFFQRLLRFTIDSPNAFKDVSYGVCRAQLRGRLLQRFDIRDFNQDRNHNDILLLFTNMKTNVDVETLAGCTFSQQKVDQAFRHLGKGCGRDIEALEAFFKYWMPSHVGMIEGIHILECWNQFCFDWIRSKRFMLFDPRRKVPLSNDEIEMIMKERKSGPFLSPFSKSCAMDYLLLDAAKSDKSSRIDALLGDDSVAPTQELIDEAFRVAVDREFDDCIKAFLDAPVGKRPSLNLVRELIPSEHPLHHLVQQLER